MQQSIAISQLLPILGAIVAFLFAALLVLYIFRLLFGQRIRAPGSRTRQRRLDIVDTFELGRERQLVIVRRDNVEHLLMIGGPNDVLVEGAIARTEAREQRPAPAREREPAPQQSAGWPATPATQQAAAAQPTSPAGGPQQIAEPTRRRHEPAPAAQAAASASPPLPPDLFAPPAGGRPSSPPFPEPPPAFRGPGPGASSPPPLRPTPTAPHPAAPAQQAPAPPRSSPPPFLARTQRSGGPAPAKREVSQAPTSPQEPATGTRESAPSPSQNAAPPDALESLEAEMARLLGRPDPE
jgi:flagellar protein FliO/FliZ